VPTGTQISTHKKPAFSSIGETTDGYLTKVFTGKLTVVDALAFAQASASSKVRKASYYK